jgi:hypothetical protein
MSMYSLYYEREADERDRTAREADLAMEAYQMAADNERAMEEEQEPEIDPLVQALVQKHKERMMIQEAFDIAESQRNVSEYNCDNPEIIELTYLAIYGMHFYPQDCRPGSPFRLDWH